MENRNAIAQRLRVRENMSAKHYRLPFHFELRDQVEYHCSLAQAPEADKKDPATLTVVTALDPSEPIEELVSHSMRLLDTLVVEAAARRE